MNEIMIFFINDIFLLNFIGKNAQKSQKKSLLLFVVSSPIVSVLCIDDLFFNLNRRKIHCRGIFAGYGGRWRFCCRFHFSSGHVFLHLPQAELLPIFFIFCWSWNKNKQTHYGIDLGCPLIRQLFAKREHAQHFNLFEYLSIFLFENNKEHFNNGVKISKTYTIYPIYVAFRNIITARSAGQIWNKCMFLI